MKKYLFFMCFILLYSISFAQIPKSEQEIRKEMAQQRENFYRQEMLKEQQVTAIGEMYDVKYYSIDLTPDTVTKTITGTVKIIGEVLASAFINSVDLSFADHFTVTDIHLSELPEKQLTYSRGNNTLIINLGSNFLQGEQFSVEISYHGKPKGQFYFDTYNSEAVIMALWEPFNWWPCKLANDNADSIDIRVAVPKELVVVSSGSLKEVIIEGDTTIYWWHEQYPIGAYGLSLAIYPYEIRYDDYLYNNGADTMKIHFYNFYADRYEINRAVYDQVKDMIAFFAERFGEYPYVREKLAIVDVRGTLTNALGIAQQTIIGLSFYQAWCFAHEISHQWWGSSTSNKGFQHYWLTEGFATYSEALWMEHAKYPGDVSTTGEYLNKWCRYLGTGTIFQETDEYNISLSYSKASYVLHMLRHMVGDIVFFDILRTYSTSPEYRYGFAITEDFQGICEQVSGINLEKFFHQWIYEERYPFYEYNWNYTPDNNGYKVTLDVDQVQQERVADVAPIFWMPIDIKITMQNSDTTFVIWDSLKTQTFEFIVDEEPSKLELDPDNWILKEASFITGIEDENINTAEKLVLLQNYPNPFSTSTVISYQLPSTADVELSVYDLLGQKETTLVKERQQPGSYEVTWHATDFPDGIYFYRLKVGSYVEIRRMVLIK